MNSTSRQLTATGGDGPGGARSWASTPARQRRILDAALACFERKGVGATTIEDICAAAGQSVGSVYHHFGSKDEIVERLVGEALAEYLAGIVDSLERESILEDSLRRLVGFHVRWVEERPALTRMMLRWDDAERDGPRGRQHYEEYNERIGAWLRREARAGRIRRLHPDLYSVLFMGPLMEHARQRSAGVTKISLAAVERGLVAGLLRVLTPSDAAAA